MFKKAKTTGGEGYRLKEPRLRPLNRPDDRELIEDLKAGDVAALGSVYNTHVQNLIRYASQFTTDRDIVLDSIQEVFLYLLDKKDDLKNIRSIRPYLYKSLYHQLMKQLAGNRPLEKSRLDKAGFEFEIEFSSQTRMIFDETYSERLQKMNASLTGLSGKQRQAILLYFYEGFTHQEVADIMGLKHKNSASKLISRSLRLLRKILQ
ncbi:RNA polymerase sigma factor [Fulvivirga sp. M361]|uniref:RNA polymerase sigma factor n=1 Tax=Fulvivirga sp. M361 TaxID=2594266 RepID=UPI0016291435|nr:sigma-70 family RNA polymerase sigma factor [Fulvivirga sp. M361]